MTEVAKTNDKKAILRLYESAIEKVNTTSVKLGWNINTYPDGAFIDTAIKNDEMYVLRDGEQIIAAAVVNHKVNPEYDGVDWKVKGPKEKIATIHALAVSSDKQGSGVGKAFLKDIDDICKDGGDVAIHLDVIDTNIPAYKMYIGDGYKEVSCIKMYYEVVGTREFWMMEKVL